MAAEDEARTAAAFLQTLMSHHSCGSDASFLQPARSIASVADVRGCSEPWTVLLLLGIPWCLGPLSCRPLSLLKRNQRTELGHAGWPSTSICTSDADDFCSRGKLHLFLKSARLIERRNRLPQACQIASLFNPINNSHWVSWDVPMLPMGSPRVADSKAILLIGAKSPWCWGSNGVHFKGMQHFGAPGGTLGLSASPDTKRHHAPLNSAFCCHGRKQRPVKSRCGDAEQSSTWHPLRAARIFSTVTTPLPALSEPF